MPKKDPCKRFACLIQDCLDRNNYQISACQHALEDMKECCRKWGAESFVCEGIKVEPSDVNNERATKGGLRKKEVVD